MKARPAAWPESWSDGHGQDTAHWAQAMEGLWQQLDDATLEDPELDWEQYLVDTLGEGPAAEHVREVVQARNRVTHKGFGLIAHTPGRQTASMRERFLHYLASAECMKDLRSAPTQDIPDGAHRLAPFVAWMQKTRLGSSVRAEALAHLHLYIESGWAERDLSNRAVRPAQHRKVVQRLRRLADRMVAGEDVSAAELTAVIQARFDHLFIPAVVVSGPKGYTIEPVTLDKKRFHVKGDTVQGPGMVDVLIRHADNPHRLMMSAATANKDTLVHRDQLARHASAIQQAASMGKPPLHKGDWLGDVMLHTVALIPDHGRSELGTDMRQAWAGAGLPWSSTRQALFFNLLPLFSVLGAGLNSSRLSTSMVLRTRHFQMGSRGGDLDLAQTDEELAEQVALFLSEGMKELGAASPWIRFRSSHRRFEGKKVLHTTLDMLIQACEGLLSHYAGIDDTDPMEPLEKRECCRKVRERLKEAVPAMLAVAEQGMAQLDDPPWAKALLGLASRLDERVHLPRKYQVGNTRSVRALSRERAEAMALQESQIEARERRVTDYWDQACLRRPAPPTAARAKLLRAAVRLDDQSLDHLLHHLGREGWPRRSDVNLDDVLDTVSLLRFTGAAVPRRRSSI